MKRTLSVFILFLFITAVRPGGFTMAGDSDPPTHGVYLRLANNLDASVDEAAAITVEAIEAAGWSVVANYPTGVDDDCSYGAHVLVVHAPEYSAKVLAHGPDAAFALPLRIAVVEDEQGTHVAAANPLSLTRTIIDETAFADDAAAVTEQLRDVVAAAFPDRTVSEEYGQLRERGYIAKTMGIMAGGPFTDKVETVITVDLDESETLMDVAHRLYTGLEELSGEWTWGTRPQFLLDLSEYDVMLIGMTGEKIESKAFQIVGAGGNEARSDFACPGVDHAPAFPIEIVLTRVENEVHVTLVDEMFRMKMYFEDAGKRKFALNMRMPGSIENEIRDKIEDSLYR